MDRARESRESRGETRRRPQIRRRPPPADPWVRVYEVLPLEPRDPEQVERAQRRVQEMLIARGRELRQAEQRGSAQTGQAEEKGAA